MIGEKFAIVLGLMLAFFAVGFLVLIGIAMFPKRIKNG